MKNRKQRKNITTAEAAEKLGLARTTFTHAVRWMGIVPRRQVTPTLVRNFYSREDLGLVRARLKELKAARSVAPKAEAVAGG